MPFLYKSDETLRRGPRGTKPGIGFGLNTLPRLDVIGPDMLSSSKKSASVSPKVILAGSLLVAAMAFTSLVPSTAFAAVPTDYTKIQTQIRMEDYGPAESALKSVLDADPTDAKARKVLAELYEKSGKLGDATTQHNILIEQNPGDLQQYYSKADFFSRTGQFDQAMATFNEAKEVDPDSFFQTADESLNALVEANPDNENARFLLARTYGIQNKPVAALEEYNKLIAQSPDNADYHLGKGLSLVRMEQYDSAITELNKAAEISPDYEDIYRAKVRTYQLQGDYEKAVAVTNEAIEKFPESSWQIPEKETVASTETFPVDPSADDRPPPADDPYPYLDVELGGGFNHLDNDFQDWNNQYALFRTELKKGFGFYGRVQGTERFNLYDTEFQLGTFIPILPFLTYVGEGTVSPSGEVIPEFSFYNGGQLSLPYGWVVSGGHRHSEYKSGIVETGIYGLEKYYKQFRLGYTLYQGYLHGADTRYAHLISGNYYYGLNSSNVGLGVTFGDEQQNTIIPGQPLRVTDVSSVGVFLNGIHWFHPTWAFTYLLELRDFDNNTNNTDLYTNIGGQVGIRHRF